MPRKDTMSKFTILNDHPKIRNTILAEVLTDEDGDLRLRINGYTIFHIKEDGLLCFLRNEVEPQPGGYRFQIAPHILNKDED
jgi:hypothetical protein